MAISMEFKHFFFLRTSLGETALHEACHRSDLERVSAIVTLVVENAGIEEGCNFIEERNSQGLSAMDIATKDESPNGKSILAMIQDTLEKLSKIKLNISGLSYQSLVSLRHNPLFTVDSPRSVVPPPREQRFPGSMDGIPLIFQALLKNNFRSLVFRIREGDDVNQIYEGETPLTIAIYKEDSPAVLALLKAPNIDVHKANTREQRPIDIAKRKAQGKSHNVILDTLTLFCNPVKPAPSEDPPVIARVGDATET